MFFYYYSHYYPLIIVRFVTSTELTLIPAEWIRANHEKQTGRERPPLIETFRLIKCGVLIRSSVIHH